MKKRKELMYAILLIILFFSTRLLNILRLPIFVDEGVYMNITKAIVKDSALAFNSLAIEGKPIFHSWEMYPLFKLIPGNLLFAARLASVINGFIAAVGFFVLTNYLWGKKTAFIGTLLFILCPYLLFHDRIALIESAVNAAFVWILFMSILLIRSKGYSVLIAFTIVASIALLIKSTVRVFFGLSLLAPLLIFENTKKFYNKFFLFLLQISIIFAISIGVFYMQKISPYFFNIAQKNTNFVIPLSVFISHPFALVPENISRMSSFLLWETGFLPVLFGILGFIYLFKNDRRLFTYLFLWFFIPSMVFIFMLKVFLPRYIIFLPTLTILLTSYFISKQKNSLQIVLISCVAGLNLYFNYGTLFNPQQLYFPFEKHHYIEGLGAGWGVKEIIEIARKEAKKKPVIIVGQGTFGLIGDMLASSVNLDDKNIQIDPYWPLEKEQIVLYKTQTDKTIYVVFVTKPTEKLPLTLIRKFEKPGRKASPLYLYQLNPHL